MQRWRLAWQREIASRTAVEVAYSGSYADRQGITIREDFLPEQYWSSGNVRDTSANDFLTQNVPNPFNISNFASLQTTDPHLYQRMPGYTVFTPTDIQRHRLLRAFPHMNTGPGLRYLDQPLGVIKAHTLEVVLKKRYTFGLSGHAAFSANPVTENRTVEKYGPGADALADEQQWPALALDRVGLYELPFGPGKPFLDNSGFFATSPADGASAARSKTSQARCSTGATFFSTGTWTISRRTIPRSRFCPMGRSTRRRPGSTPTPDS